jgi:four helix bundle protein
MGASISVLSNFAEGFERGGNAEFNQFLSFSQGSVGELRAQLIYALDRDLIDDDAVKSLDAIGESATRLLGGPMRYLQIPTDEVENTIQRNSPSTDNPQLRTVNSQSPTPNSLASTINYKNFRLKGLAFLRNLVFCCPHAAAFLRRRYYSSSTS